MPGRLAILLVVFTLGLAPAEAGVAATPRDAVSTHVYLLASYRALHAVVTGWSSAEASIRKLDLSLHDECPLVGAGSPQSEPEQQLSTEVAGALIATYYHTDAPIVRAFARAVSPLRWSSPSITRLAHKLAQGRRALTLLPIPDLCGDVRLWRAGGFGPAPATTERYNRRVEAIEVKEIPLRLLATISIKDAAARLGVHENTVRAWFDGGILEGYVSPTGRRKVLLDAVERRTREMFGVPIGAVELGEPTAPPRQLDTLERAQGRLP